MGEMRKYNFTNELGLKTVMAKITHNVGQGWGVKTIPWGYEGLSELIPKMCSKYFLAPKTLFKY